MNKYFEAEVMEHLEAAERMLRAFNGERIEGVCGGMRACGAYEAAEEYARVAYALRSEARERRRAGLREAETREMEDLAEWASRLSEEARDAHIAGGRRGFGEEVIQVRPWTDQDHYVAEKWRGRGILYESEIHVCIHVTGGCTKRRPKHGGRFSSR